MRRKKRSPGITIYNGSEPNNSRKHRQAMTDYAQIQAVEKKLDNSTISKVLGSSRMRI